MTDQLKDVFAAARSSALAEVRPPGIAAAHRTVKRRRTVRSIAAAAAIVAAAAGAVVVSSRDDRIQTARPAAPASDLSAWANNASLAVGVDHHQGPAEVLTSTGTGEMRAVESTFGGGTYEVTAACAGEGAMTLAFGIEATVAVPCSSPARPVHASVTVPESMEKTQVRAVPDATAAGWSVVAFQMKLSDRDRNRLEEVAAAALPGNAGSTVNLTGRLPDGLGFRDSSLGPGRYRAWFSCFGTGTVRLTVDLVTDEQKERKQRAAQANLTCSPTATSGSVSFTVPATGVDAVDATVTPAPDALGAAALRLDRR